MKLPRILFIIDYYHPHIGGLEVVFGTIIQHLLDQGYHVGVLTTKHLSTLPSYEIEGNLQIRRVGKRRETFLFRALLRGSRIIKQFDVIHTTTYASAIPASLLGTWFSKKVILTVHEIFGPTLRQRYKPYRRRLYQRFEQIIFWFSYDHIVCVSKYTRKMLRKLYMHKQKLHLIYNGIDRTIWNKKNKDLSMMTQFRTTHQLHKKFVLLYYGHSGASKGLGYFVRSIPTIVKEYPNTKVILNIAPGKRDYKILALIKKLNIEQYCIVLHGVHQDILVNLVHLSHAVVVPSVSEGFGLVAAEVSALKHPLIVSKKASLPEVVSGKVIFLENYQPASFVTAVTKVKKKEWAKTTNQTFDRETTVEKYKQLY